MTINERTLISVNTTSQNMSFKTTKTSSTSKHYPYNTIPSDNLGSNSSQHSSTIPKFRHHFSSQPMKIFSQTPLWVISVLSATNMPMATTPRSPNIDPQLARKKLENFRPKIYIVKNRVAFKTLWKSCNSKWSAKRCARSPEPLESRPRPQFIH